MRFAWAGVFLAFCLAEASVARASDIVPFVPPPSWTAYGASVEPTAVVTWYRISSEKKPVAAREAIVFTIGETPSFAVRAQPQTAGVAQVRATSRRTSTPRTRIPRRPAFAHDPHSKILYAGHYTVCGTQGLKLTLGLQGQPPRVSALDLISHGGRTYTITYTRPASSMPDARAWKVMDSFCPRSAAQIAAVKPPPGWRAVRPRHVLEPLGVWRSGAQFLRLTRASATPGKRISQTTAAARADIAGLEPQSGAHLLSVESGVRCGEPVTTFAEKFGRLGFEVLDDIEITSDASHLYFLEYLRPANVHAEPAAMAALKSLCLAAPSAAPNRSLPPEPSPSATASGN